VNRGWSYHARVEATPAEPTVLAYLAARYPHSSADTWAARIASGEVELAGRVATACDPLQRGDVIVWHRPPWHEPEVPTDFAVIHEDRDVVAVAKPSGLPTMPAGGFLEHTLLHLVQHRYPGVRPLHRLGRFTSGLVLFARTAAAAASLAAAWRALDVDKGYRALLSGSPRWDACDATMPIGPVPHPRLGAIHAARDDGRPAHSRFQVVERRDATTLVDVAITTGRPHQIRIHAAWSGHPLAGDPLYAPGGRPRPDDPGLPGDGGYHLHAWRLRCRHPTGGDDLRLEAPLPVRLARTT